MFFAFRRLFVSELMGAVAYPGILAPGARHRNGCPDKNGELQISQLFVGFSFICLNNLKFVE
jgi:hypothetical protein